MQVAYNCLSSQDQGNLHNTRLLLAVGDVGPMKFSVNDEGILQMRPNIANVVIHCGAFVIAVMIEDHDDT